MNTNIPAAKLATHFPRTISRLIEVSPVPLHGTVVGDELAFLKDVLIPELKRLNIEIIKDVPRGPYPYHWTIRITTWNPLGVKSWKEVRTLSIKGNYKGDYLPDYRMVVSLACIAFEQILEQTAPPPQYANQNYK